jgi:hypothetical protein
MSTANPEPYSERIRLAEIIADARALMARADPGETLAQRCGQLEATLKMLADSAAGALRLNEPGGVHVHTGPDCWCRTDANTIIRTVLDGGLNCKHGGTVHDESCFSR